MRVTAITVKKRIATSLIIVSLIVLGLYGLFRLPMDFLPDITHPLVRVIVYWRGATPEEIITSIADPIERQVATVDGLDYMESTSIEGMYLLEANYQYGTDIDVAYQDVLAAMSRATRQLPRDIDAPLISKADPSQLPMAQLVISSDLWDMVKLRTWTDEWFKDQILTVQGVGGTEIIGGLKREIHIHLDPEGLEKHGLSLSTVVNRLNQENIEQFAGRITSGPREIIARTMGAYRTLDEIKSIVLARDGQSKVYLRDVARVEDDHEEIRIVTRLGGKPSVKLSVLKQADANTVAVAKGVRQKMQELLPTLPQGVRVEMLENQADYIESAVAGVRNAALEAAALVIFVIYLFLGSWRQALVMILALPITLILNFALMKLAGFSLNIFSLGGLVVAIGVILDNSIVVLENITRLNDEYQDKPIETLAVDGTHQVGPAVIAATLSFLALFVPFLLVPGLTSLLFKELILVVVGIVLISLLVAITMTPMLTSLLLGKLPSERRKTRFERFFERVTNLYGRSLGWTLHRKWIVLGAFTFIVIGAGLLLNGVGSEFLPRMDDGRIMVKVKLPTGASVEQTDQVLRQLESRLSEDPLVQSMFTLVGGRVQGTNTYEVANEGEIDLQLVPQHARKLTTDEYIKRIRPLVSQVQVPGGKVMVSQMKTKGLRQVGKGDVEIEIKGPEITQLFELARRTSAVMNELAHFANVYVAMDLNKPEYQVKIDRTRAAELGVSVSDIATTLRSLISGAVATRFKEGDEYYNIRVMVSERDLKHQQSVENLPITFGQGGILRVHDVAKVVPATGPVEILRRDQVKKVIVSGDASGVSIGQAIQELKGALGAMDIPGGYEISLGGQAQMMSDMKRELLAVLGFAIFFAFVILGVQFNSFKLPAMIIGSVPACLGGVVFLLWVTGLPLGSTVIIGALLTVAATVNDGVLLLTFAEELQADGSCSPVTAILNAGKIRLRPRVMTSLPIIAGMVPLALKLEEGGDMLQPMAVAAIGGMTLEIMVALFLMPCLYTIFTRETVVSSDKIISRLIRASAPSS